jgi:Lamin Tail Domain/CotH kinase protein
VLLGPPETLVGLGGGWIYQQGVDLGANWAQATYTAGAGGWQAGTGAFAFDETPPPVSVGTVLADPTTAANPVCYFQKSFTFSGNPAQTQLSAQVLLDDGAVVYLNGNEIARQNMPAGPVTAATRATSAVGNATLSTISLPAQFLVAGTNTLSVSLHEAPPDAALPPVLTRVEEGGTMDAAANLALATRGSVPFAKDLLPGYPNTHTIDRLNNGTYGNSSSWIGNSANSFCGVSIGAAPVMIAGLAFGRDNTGGFTDRTNGTYTIQYTTVPNPTAATPDGSWTTINTLTYAGASTPFFSLPSRRHRYEFPAVSATGLRMICSTNGICVDEIELYGPRLPDLVFDFSLSSQEILPLPSDTRVVINEIGGTSDAVFRIELKNEGTAPVALAGMKLGAFTLPATTLDPGAFVVFDQTQLGFRPVDGDRVFLLAAGGGTLLDAVVARATGRARSGGRMVVASAATFGAENTFAFQEDVVISEVMYHFPPNSSVPGIPATTTWRYNRSNVDLGAAWAQSAHAVGGDWFSGQALLGFESTPAALPDTLRTPFATSNAPTYYFETDFTLTAEQVATITELQLERVIDDGAAFYINGVEIQSARFNLSAGFSFSTLVTVGVGNAVLSTPVAIPVAGLNLQAGVNRLSVEVHQQIATSNDMVCGARLSAVTTVTPAIPPVPVSENPEEWVELHNKSTAPVSIAGWALDGGVSFTFPAGTTIPAGGYLVVAKNASALAAKWPEQSARIIGDFSGSLSNSGERIALKDAVGNPADEVRYFTGGAWPETPDGGGASLELRDPRADNAPGSAWAASDESGEAPWQNVSYTMTGAQLYGQVRWNEFRFGMLDAGECLVDDVSVLRVAGGQQLIQGGNFESLPEKWRMLGNHGTSAIETEPGNPGNHVLHIRSTGAFAWNHNHVETSFIADTPLVAGENYTVSFRARWLSGTNQLNSRAYYSRLARTTELPMATRIGTPGAPNSRAVANLGPTLSGLAHSPVIPDPGAPVTVTATAADPDGVAALTLRYALNGSPTFASVPMTASAATYSGQIPGQAAGAIVQFYIEAVDNLAAASALPAAGPSSRALYLVNDGAGTALAAHELRVIMLPADTTSLLAPLNRISDGRIGGSAVYRRSEAFYDVGVRLQGTVAGRIRDGEDYVGYDVGFPADRLFRGVHNNVNIDRSGRGPVVRQQHEIYVKHLFHRAGVPCTYDDLVYFIAPNAVHTGTAILQMAGYGGEFLSSEFGGDGTVFNLEITYEPNSTTDGNFESLKNPVPHAGHVASDFGNFGADKEHYRGLLEPRAGGRADDFTGLIPFSQAMVDTSPAFAANIAARMDVDQWMRVSAIYSLFGLGDCYINGGLQHNLRIHVPSDGLKVRALPWDMDFVHSAGSGSAAILAGGNLLRVINNVPGARHAYYGHLHEICQTIYSSTYMNPWLAHYGGVVGQSFTGNSAYIDARRASVLAQLPANVVFAITSNGGADFTVGTASAPLAGNGWVNVREIRRADTGAALDIAWTTDTSWTTVIGLNFGPNPITLVAYDGSGAQVGADSITITSTLSAPTPVNFLRITEVHYHPAQPTGAELSASTDKDDFEFVELRNMGTQPLDISGCKFVAGVDFTFPAGTTLGGGETIHVVSRAAAFAARYGTGPRIAGAYGPADALSNSGETITLVDATGAVIQSFAYDDSLPWPENADGAGHSLVAIAPALNLDRNLASSWRASAGMGGNPNTSDDTTFTGTPTDDDDLDGLNRFLEYALGTSDSVPTAAAASLVIEPAGTLLLTFTRSLVADDVALTIESASVLPVWSPASAAIVARTQSGTGVTETWRVTPAPGPAAFVRLKAATR